MLITNTKIFPLSILIFNCFYMTFSAILPNDNLEKRPLVHQQTPSFDDDNIRKNDDAHLRLYFKSNSPGRSISHEMEQRLVKSPSYQYQVNPHLQGNFQPKFDLNYFDPRNSFVPNQFQSNQMFDTNKNGQTLLNLHYHGNSLNGLDSTINQFAQQQQQQQQQQIENQKKAQRANILRMLLLNMSPNQQFAMPQPIQSPQPQFENIQEPKNDLQYKIVHLKFKIEPQLGRILGQGFVETDNGAGSLLNSKRFSVLPQEIPELVKKLLVSAQPQSNNLQRSGFIKRSDESKSSYNDESSFEKREESDKNETIETKEDNKRVKKGVESLRSDEDDKMNDSEFSESFKSLQRRDDSEYVSLAENEDEKLISARDDEQESSKSSLSESYEIN